MTTGHGLTIVVEPSDYVLRNAGDMAMMQVAVTRLSNRWPDAEIAVFSDAPDRVALLASAHSLGLWALHPNRAYVTRELVDAAHAAGLRVNAWTVNDADEIARFAALGVDGIMSNWPERIPKG